MTGPASDRPGPIVPATLDGWSLLHQAFRLRWPALRALSPAARTSLASGLARSLELYRKLRRGEIDRRKS